jgi:hypothetical protein
MGSQFMLKARNKCPQSGDIIVSTGVVCTSSSKYHAFPRICVLAILENVKLMHSSFEFETGFNFTKTCFLESMK